MNDSTQTTNDDPAMLDNVKQLASEPAHAIEPSQTPPSPAPFSEPSSTPPNFTATHTAEPAQGFSSTPLPSDPAVATTDDNSSQPVVAEPSPIVSTPGDDADDSASSDESSPIVDPVPPAASTESPDPEHLAGMKQEALEHLEPLVEHLDGTPEETFKTTMMMIQANDNHTLLQKALESAKKIEDDKARAQAMLDIVNEINYFSQN